MKTKRVLAWIYDIGFSLIILSLIMAIFTSFEDIFIITIVVWLGLMFYTWGCSWYYEFKEKHHTAWGLGLVLVQIVFVPLYYFKMLRPYWVGKKKKVYK